VRADDLRLVLETFPPSNHHASILPSDQRELSNRSRSFSKSRDLAAVCRASGSITLNRLSTLMARQPHPARRKPCAFDQGTRTRRATVHDPGHLGTSNSTSLVDVGAGQGCHQMLDRQIVSPSPLGQHGCTVARRLYSPSSRISAPASMRLKHDPRVWGGRRRVILNFRTEWRPTPRHPIGRLRSAVDAVVISPNTRQNFSKTVPTKVHRNGAPVSSQSLLFQNCCAGQYSLVCRPPKSMAMAMPEEAGRRHPTHPKNLALMA